MIDKIIDQWVPTTLAAIFKSNASFTVLNTVGDAKSLKSPLPSTRCFEGSTPVNIDAQPGPLTAAAVDWNSDENVCSKKAVRSNQEANKSYQLR